MTSTRAPRHPSTSSVTTKGQVTIPVHIRRLLGVKPGDRVEFRLENGHVVVAPAQSIVERTKGIFKSNRPPLSAERERELTEIAIAEEVVRRSGLKR